jgi:glycosyltransferase involved in cell wall biosynthesis
MSTPLISICIPAYNQTEFLKKTLDSIAVQTFKNFEVIISDDSVNDEVRKLTENYGDKFKLIYHKNPSPLGSPANWNKALDLSSGDLIKFMHHDDWFKSLDSLEKFARPFENKETLFAFCVSEILNMTENKVSFNRPPQEFIDKIKEDPKKLFNDNRIGSPSAVMFKRSNLRFDEKVKYVVDVDFYIQYLKPGNFAFIDQPLIVNTSNHPGQVTTASLNRETQVAEYAYLYDKVFGNQIPSRNISGFFISIFKKYSVKSLKEVEELSGVKLKPEWYFKLLLLRSRI